MTSKKHIGKLTRLGTHSYYVVIPPEMIRELGWRERQRLRVTKKNGSIVTTDWKKK